MRRHIRGFTLIGCIISLGIWYSFKQRIQPQENLLTLYSYTNLLENVRLGDGMLLGVETYVRWKVDSVDLFYTQFDNMMDYSNDVLYPRQSELANEVTFQYDKRAFKSKSIRKKIKMELADLMCQKLREKGISILEVEIVDIYKQRTLAEVVADMKVTDIDDTPPFKKHSKKTPTTQNGQKTIDKLPQMQSTTITMLQKVEEKLQETLIINSGYRNKEHNERVNGVPNSAHLRGYAVDIAIYSKAHRQRLVKALEEVGFKRIGVYSHHVHADNDPSLKDARW